MARFLIDTAVNTPASIAAGAAALWDSVGGGAGAVAEPTQQPEAQAPTQPAAPVGGWNSGWQRMLQQRGQLNK